MSGQTTDIGWVDGDEIDSSTAAAANGSGTYILKTHDISQKAVSLGNVKFLYSVRDMRDVIVSTMRKFNVDFETALGWCKHKSNQYFEYSDRIDCFVSRYENLVGNLAPEIQKISEHLGISISEGKSREIAQDLTPENQKKRMSAFQRKLEEGLLSSTSENKGFDPESLLHVDHILNGSSGYFAEYLSSTQLTRIENEFYQWNEIWRYW